MEYQEFQRIKPIAESFLNEVVPGFKTLDFVSRINLVGKTVFWLFNFSNNQNLKA